jgi:hypothetical protein
MNLVIIDEDDLDNNKLHANKKRKYSINYY